MLNINNVCSQVKTKFSGLEIIPPWNITSGIIFTTIFWWMTSSRNFVFPLLDSTNLDLGMITIGVEGLGSRSATVFSERSFCFIFQSTSWWDQLSDFWFLFIFIIFLFCCFWIVHECGSCEWTSRPPGHSIKRCMPIRSEEPKHAYANHVAVWSQRRMLWWSMPIRIQHMPYANQNTLSKWQCRRSRTVHVKTLIGRFLPFYTSTPVCWGSVYAF